MRLKTRNTIVTFGFALVLPLLSCTDLVSPGNGVRLRPETKLANIVVADSFAVTLDATPNGSVPMHTYTDPVYAEVWATGSITLHSNPAEPGYFGPINTTNGPVYAGGSFISGGGCGLYVRVYYPGYYGVDVQGSPCNDSSANWRGIGLFQGSGTATRGGAISETGRTCHPMTEPCHSQEGSQQVWVRPLPTELVLTANASKVTRATSVGFDVSANPNLMASGGGRPRRVTAWRWKRANLQYQGPDTTNLSSCAAPAQSCSVTIYERGRMSVDAIVNGVAQTKTVLVDVIPAACHVPVSTVAHPISAEYGSTGPSHTDPHLGRDYQVPEGTPVYAPDSGKVMHAQRGETSGLGIVIRSTNVNSYFFHLSVILVQTGQTVTAGTLIGYTGDTGHSTGPHLHFEQHTPGPIWKADGHVPRATGIPPCTF